MEERGRLDRHAGNGWLRIRESRRGTWTSWLHWTAISILVAASVAVAANSAPYADEVP
jgi:hypothetical protein